MKKSLIVIIIALAVIALAGAGYYLYKDDAVDTVPDLPGQGQSGGDAVDIVDKGECEEFTKVGDLYGEWPLYYDQCVEFEGYVVYAYECPPCPPGAVCEACLKPYYSVAKEPVSGERYYQSGQVIVQHTLGEEIKQDSKYRIRGRLLPPEQAFMVDIAASVQGDFPAIEPSEPAVEITQ
ncbi:hypothetical protein KJ969_02850 [Patescibacteria group bacterium]|nr:hypothetical protein [Patescibacteria group bacterium]MBU1922552.1 hypothetical protein [Patescibacteria group bacterium]